MGHNILPDHGTGCDEGVCTDFNSTDDRGIGPDRGTLAHGGIAVFVLADDRGTWVVDVGEDHAWAAEDIILEGDVVVDGDVVLDLDVVTNDHSVANVDILTK